MLKVLLLWLACAVTMLVQDPADVASRFNRAVALQRNGSLEEAEREYRALLERAPSYAEAHANLGAVLARLGRYEEAVAAYDSALRLNPRLTPVLLNLGIAHYRQGEFERAVVLFQRFLAQEPNHLQALQLAAAALIELDRAGEAADLLKRALAIDSTSPDARKLLEKVTSGASRRENDFVGSAACVPCHRPQSERQLASNMARAAFRPEEHPLFSQFKNQAARVMGLRILFLWEKAPFRISISDDQREVNVPVHWALGAGVHGVTFFSRLERGKYLENVLSYYPKSGTLDFTPGQGELKFQTLQEAAGKLNHRPEAYRCLSCHTTGTRDRPEAEDIEVGELGVRCEACHGPGKLHLETVKQQKWEDLRRTIDNPRHSTARQVLEQCGACHREPPADPARVNWKDPANARFQPIGLSQSLCFQKSSGALSCLTCHDAHSNASQDAAFYTRVCAGCHTRSSLPPAAGCTTQSGGGCVTCHMPRVEAIRRMEFSNHWIGIYGANKLVPGPRTRP